MAARFFVNGGVDNNWGTSGNWSTTSGGGGGASVPTSADAVTLDASSPNCILNTSARDALTLTCTAYTNTLTFTNTLTVAGNITLGASMAFAGTSALLMNASATLTTNGVTLPVPFTFRSNTLTLADDFHISAALLLSVGLDPTVNGQTCYVGANLSNAGNVVSGTTVFILNGTGTIATGGRWLVTMTFNTAGTITIAGTFRHGTGTLTYTAGTMVVTGSTFELYGSGTVNTAGMTWNHVTTNNTSTLTSNLVIAGTLTLCNTTDTVLNGFTAVCSGPVTFTGTVGNHSGTTVLKLTTTETLTIGGSGSQSLQNNITLDAGAGTITITGLRYSAGTMSYVSGTIVGQLAITGSGGGTGAFSSVFLGGF